MNKRHGFKGRNKYAPEYPVWNGMIQRCENPNHKSYPRYGGRGIAICARWRESFTNFLLDMGPRPAEGYSIERLNNNLGYDPSNCVWATAGEQIRNRSNTVMLIVAGEQMTVAEYAARNAINYQAAMGRVKRARTSCAGGLVTLRDGATVL